ncbi:MAG: flagellar basal-body rod protein FlgF [bacterium]
MINGLWTAASGFLKEEKNLDVIANNLANVNTVGYKADRAVFRVVDNSSDKLRGGGINNLNRNKAINSCALLDLVYTDLSAGPIEKTGNKLDVVINGEGFFAVKGSDEIIKYTRDGRFQINSENKLVTISGEEVQGGGGPINLEGGEVNIDKEGNIYINGNMSAQLTVVSFEKNELLQKIGDNLYLLPNGAGIEPIPFKGEVAQGYVEGSNVKVIKEMVGMITSLRAFETYQKVIQSQMVDTTQRLINETGKI